MLECAPLLKALSVQYVPQVGYLVVVEQTQVQFLPQGDTQMQCVMPSESPAAASVTRSDVVDDDAFVFVFQQGDNCYFKNRRMRGRSMA